MMTALNPKHGKFVKPEGYADLGWQVHSGNCPTLKKCHEAGHELAEYDNSYRVMRGTEFIYTCHICRFIYHIDMSD